MEMADGERELAVVVELPDTEEAAERALRLATRAAVQLVEVGCGFEDGSQRVIAWALDAEGRPAPLEPLVE